MPERQRTRPFTVPESEYPFESRWFDYGDAAMHYLDEGEGMPVLLLHGNPTWSFLYRKVILDLGGNCRAIAPDYPGFGFSGHPAGYGYTPPEHAQAIGSLIDHLGLDEFILVMQDWGGPIGMAVAETRPEAVKGMVVCNTWCWPADLPVMRLFSRLMGSALGRYLILRHNLFADRLMAGALRQSGSPGQEVLAIYREPFPTPEARMGTYVFPREIIGAGDWLADLERGLPVLKHVPVEFVWGMRDPIFNNPKVLRRWLRHFPDSPVDRLADAGHFLQEDRPEAIAAAVNRLLYRQPA